MGPAQQKLQVLRQFTGSLSSKQNSSNETIFVVKDLRTNLLGLPAILALNLVTSVAEVSDDYCLFI